MSGTEHCWLRIVQLVVSGWHCLWQSVRQLRDYFELMPVVFSCVSPYHTRVEKYIRTLVEKTKPKMILVCMIYYPDLNPNTMSWADLPLSFLRYQQKPSKLQGLISKAFEHATSWVGRMMLMHNTLRNQCGRVTKKLTFCPSFYRKPCFPHSAIQVPGTQVIPVPLFTVLDGKHSEEYCERVEPSPSGGKLMARMFLEIIDHRLAAEGGAGYSNNNTPEGKMNAPSSETMTGRG